MSEQDARTVLQSVYESRESARDSCFGDCCLRGDEKEALLVLIFGVER